MVHYHSFFQMFLHTLQNVDLYWAVRKTDTKEFGFEFVETLFVLPLLFCVSSPFLPFPVVCGIRFVLGRVPYAGRWGKHTSGCVCPCPIFGAYPHSRTVSKCPLCHSRCEWLPYRTANKRQMSLNCWGSISDTRLCLLSARFPPCCRTI